MSDFAAHRFAPGGRLAGPTQTKARVGLLLAGLGSLSVGMACIGLFAIRDLPEATPPVSGRATTQSPTETGPPLQPDHISVLRVVYDPGVGSGWHTHSGLHAIAVLSGTLTVYDARCGRSTFDRDHPYIGGQELHLARNETARPIEMIVTFVDTVAMTAAGTSTTPVVTPACATGG